MIVHTFAKLKNLFAFQELIRRKYNLIKMNMKMYGYMFINK